MCAARYAQHFLINRHAIERIVESLELKPDEPVLEIGPGKGALTTYLVRRAKDVYAVEVDDEMIVNLKNKLGATANFHLIHSSILEYDLKSLPVQQKIKVVGNLPYNLTSPIFRLMSNWDGWTEAWFMVQKEVGERLCAKVGSENYGALTVGMSLTCKTESVFTLAETSFKPAPRVKSMVVKLTRRLEPLSPNVPAVQRVIQAAFQQRRKTILNSLSHGLGLTKEETNRIVLSVGLEPTIRPEDIDVEKFIALSRHIAH